MFQPVCVKVRLTLCEWHSAGLHAALQPAGISLKINGVAAVWEGCQGGSFDSAQTPFGINLQSREKGSPSFAEYRFQLQRTRMWPSGRSGEELRCQHAKPNGRPKKSLCMLLGLGDAGFILLSTNCYHKIDWGCGMFFKARGQIRRVHNVKWIGSEFYNVFEGSHFLAF